ncbi:MAG: flagellar biosynthesis protein [Paracoccaceae bacterium]
MTRRVQLEVFELPDVTDGRVELAQGELEECRLAAYEQGYTAGWEDAVAAQSSDISRLRADLGRNLADLSFTYHEAHSHVLRSLEPLLKDMVTKVLPAVARESLGQMVLEHIRPIAKTLADGPIVVVAHPINRASLEDLLVRENSFPLEFEEEPSLGEGQVHLRLGAHDARVDLDGVIGAISAAVSAFFTIEKQREKAHG